MLIAGIVSLAIERQETVEAKKKEPIGNKFQVHVVRVGPIATKFKVQEKLCSCNEGSRVER